MKFNSFNLLSSRLSPLIITMIGTIALAIFVVAVVVLCLIGKRIVLGEKQPDWSKMDQ
jgi:hypothetical protein